MIQTSMTEFERKASSTSDAGITLESEAEEKNSWTPPSPTPSSRTSLNSTLSCTNHYLSFTTPLPLPVFSPSITPIVPPDLKKFTSPFEWSSSRKSFTLWISCVATMVAGYTAGSYAPPAKQMALEWGVSEIVILVGITTFCAGFAIAPMILAPFSEINGRYPVFVGAGLVYLVSRKYSVFLILSYDWKIVLASFTKHFSWRRGGYCADYTQRLGVLLRKHLQACKFYTFLH